LAAEEILEALEDGDRPIEPRTIRHALAHRTFRRVYLGAWLSNVGSWMQNVILGAYVFKITGSAAYVSLVPLAQLGPLLLFSLVGGALADRFDRRRLLIAVAFEQLGFSMLIAWITTSHHPSIWALLAAVLGVGAGQAVYAPTYSALIPTLVERRDMPAAVSLNSASMNLSRVIGPAIGGLLYAKVGAPWVFTGNAVTYLFIVAALMGVRLAPAHISGSGSRLRHMVEGFAVARRDAVVGRCLLVMVGFSFFCLPIAVLMPVLAHNNLRIGSNSVEFGILYACFGAGAVVGALSIGTFLSQRRLDRLARLGVVGFSLTLVVFSLLRQAGPAYPVAFVLGFWYFTTVTSLSTVLQTRLDDAVRGRVMALWTMAFGGTVPIGALVAGPLSDRVGITTVLLIGAGGGLLLAGFANLERSGRHRQGAP
jgi:predicted MFS family arabinose efflux permease